MDLEILKIASNTDNHKNINNQTHSSKLNNSICGDQMQIDLIVKKEKIIDFGYNCKSCIYCQASVSLLSKSAIDQTTFNITELILFAERFYKSDKKKFPKKWNVFNKLFNKKNISRKECLLLPFKTLSKALKVKNE